LYNNPSPLPFTGIMLPILLVLRMTNALQLISTDFGACPVPVVPVSNVLVYN